MVNIEIMEGNLVLHLGNSSYKFRLTELISYIDLV